MPRCVRLCSATANVTTAEVEKRVVLPNRAIQARLHFG